MKRPIYGPEFSVYPDTNPHPRRAIAYPSMRAARIAYREFCRDCDRYGQTPVDALFYVGTPAGDEERYGYPDYPDYLAAWNAARRSVKLAPT